MLIEEREPSPGETTPLARRRGVQSHLAQEMTGPAIHVRCGDSCHPFFKFWRNFFLGFIGILLLLLFIFPILFAMIGVSYLCCCCYGNGRFNDRRPSKTALCAGCFCCGARPRYMFSEWRLRLILVPSEKRGCFWRIAYFFVGFYQSLEFVLHASQGMENLVHFANDLSNKYGDYFPLLYGIGCADSARIRETMEDDRTVLKSHSILSIPLPDILRHGYAMHSPVFNSNRIRDDNPSQSEARVGNDAHRIGRRLHHALQSYFRGRNKFSLRQDLRTMIPKSGSMSVAKVERHSLEAFYYCLLGYELTPAECDILLAANTIGLAAAFMPSFIHFFLGGYYLERNYIERGILTIKGIFAKCVAREPRHPVFVELKKICDEENVPVWQALNLLTTQPLVGGIIPTVKYCLRQMREDPQTYVSMYEADPTRFVLESLRLVGNPFANTVVTMPADEELTINGAVRLVPKGTPMAMVHVCRMRDPTLFGSDCTRFNAQRAPHQSLQASPFNALEAAFDDALGNEYQQKHPHAMRRYCIGRDISLFVATFMLTQSKPQTVCVMEVAEEEVGVAGAAAALTKPTLPGTQAGGKYSISRIKTFNRRLQKMEMWVADLDQYTQLTAAAFKKAAQDYNANPDTALSIGPPRIYDPPCQAMPVLNKYMPLDDQESKRKIRDFFLRDIVANKLLIMFDEEKMPDKDWQSIDYARFYREKYFKDIPPPNVDYEELVSNRAMTQFAFYGPGCQQVRRLADHDYKKANNGAHAHEIPANAVFVHDASMLYDFEVRAGYEQYGAIAYYDKDFAIVGIYWCHGQRYIPTVVDGTHERDHEEEDEEDDTKDEDYIRVKTFGDNVQEQKEWLHAKWAYKTSVFVRVVFVEHLVWTHFMEANHLVMCSQQTLPITHPMRYFLQPFTFNTVTVNYTGSLSLINEYGFLHRLWAFPYAEVRRLLNVGGEEYKFRILPDFTHPSMKEIDDKYFPFYNDSCAFWNVMRTFVSDFMEVYYETEADLIADADMVSFYELLCRELRIEFSDGNNNNGRGNGITKDRVVDIIAQLICNVCAVHEQVGHVSDYVLDPSWVGTKIKPGKEVCQEQNYMQLLTLTLMTGLRNPQLLDDFSHLIPVNKHSNRVKQIYTEWNQNLRNLVTSIDRKNEADRVYWFCSFNPRYLECSVSV